MVLTIDRGPLGTASVSVWKMGEDAETVPPPPAELAASPPNPSTVAAAVPTDATDAGGGPNDGVSSTIEKQVPAEAAQNLAGEAAPAGPQEEAVAASPKINDATATGASFDGAAERADPMAVDSTVHAPTNGQSVRTTEEDAMELEQQNGDRDWGKNTDDSADDVVVDLLDSDDDEEVPASATGKQPQVGDIPLPAAPPAAPVEGVAVPPPAAGGGGDYSDESDIEIVGTTAAPAPPPQQQHRAGSGAPAGGAVAAARADAFPLWMKNAAAEASAAGIQLGSEEYTSLMLIRKRQNDKKEAVDKLKKRLSDLQHALRGSCDRVQKLADDGKCPRADLSHVDNVPGHIPTWEFPIPEQKRAPQRQRYVPNAIKASAFKLSLLSCSDFTITPIQRPDEWNGPRGSLAGLRIHIKKAAKPYGGAKFERADDDGNDNDDKNGDSTEGVAPVGPAGRWRIPLGAYGGLVGYLTTLVDEQGRRAYVEEIPIRNLQMATLGRELKNKAYPSARALIDEGVPSGIAKAMAPYQRGGVDFALHQDGRVLIADEMGLGKSEWEHLTFTVWPSFSQLLHSLRLHLTNISPSDNAFLSQPSRPLRQCPHMPRSGLSSYSAPQAPDITGKLNSSIGWVRIASLTSRRLTTKVLTIMASLLNLLVFRGTKRMGMPKCLPLTKRRMTTMNWRPTLKRCHRTVRRSGNVLSRRYSQCRCFASLRSMC